MLLLMVEWLRCLSKKKRDWSHVYFLRVPMTRAGVAISMWKSSAG